MNWLGKVRKTGLFIVAGMALLACEHGFFAEPAPGMAAVALNLTTTSMGGPGAAFDKADNAFVRVTSAGAVRLETTFPLQAAGGDVPISLDIPLNATSESFTIDVEIRLGSVALFRGSIAAELGTGPAPSVELMLNAVGTGFVLPATFPTLTAWGDSVITNGASVFATGDTIGSAPVSWVASLDPAVVAITGGVPVARADGSARLVGGLGAFRDTMTVTVLASVQTITVQPDAGPLPLGSTRQFNSSAFDRRGNRLTRTTTWSSSDVAVLGINATSGLATALRIGSARAIASIGTVSGNLLVEIVASAPVITNTQAVDITNVSAALIATVQTNSQATEGWFEYATNPALSGALRSPTVNLTGSATPSSLRADINSLSANATYYARAVARNSSGTTNGSVISFTTAGNQLNVVTIGASGVSTRGATIFGEITTGDDPVIAWLEWSEDPNFGDAFGGTTQQQSIPPQSGPLTIQGFADVHVCAGRKTYFRAIAYISARAQVFYGATLSFDALAECPAPPPLAAQR